MSSQDPSTWLRPGDTLMAGGYDWAWAFVWYKTIPGASGYMVGTNSTVWSGRKRTRTTGNRGTIAYVSDSFDRKMTATFDGKYLRVKIKEDGRQIGTFKSLHVVLLETFVGPRPSLLHEARHLNDDKLNNNLYNLAWGTAKENMEDRDRNGRTYQGSRHWKAVVTEDIAVQIKEDYLKTKVIAETARRFGVSHNVASRIINGKTWKDKK